MMNRMIVFLVGFILAGPVAALEVQVSEGRDQVQVIHEGKLVKIRRIQDLDHQITGGFAKTSRKCPPFCIQPMVVAPGVETVGELELFDFMENKLPEEEGYLIDARVTSWFEKGTIPGSINIPFTVFELKPDDPKLVQALQKMGGKKRNDVSGFSRSLESMGLMGGDKKTDYWDFNRAKEVVLWCNGPWCGQSPRAIRALLDLGYPAEKLKYYRGGMQMWQVFGLTTIIPGS
jgi:rhodanese-related sulfurtransferase